jgi:hypothetical protein
MPVKQVRIVISEMNTYEDIPEGLTWHAWHGDINGSS